jgi:Pentapeptide repeats (8 copies)
LCHVFEQREEIEAMTSNSEDIELEDQNEELPPWERPFNVPPGGSAAGLDLSGMELSGDLSGIDFRKAILGGWDPEDEDEDEIYGPGGTPDIQYTDFSGANLTGANFAGQDLSGLIFVGAVLQGANLSRCSLGADFTDADLSGANLRGASGINEGDFSGAIIDDIKGLSAEDREMLEELV